ncbi:MAG: response regulator [Cyanophyceae cyanobacterium]
MKGNILVVEDEKVVAKDIIASLKKFGYVVTDVVSSGEEALSKLEESTPVDLVLMDIVLKGDIDGIEAARQINARYHIPVIHLTGYADDDTLDRVKEVSPMGFLLKPFKERELYSSVEMAIYRHRQQAEQEKSHQRLEEDLRSELQKLQQFSEVKNSLFRKFLQDISDPLLNLKMALSLLLENLDGAKRDHYLKIIEQEFDREISLINQTSNLEDLLNVENVGLLSQFSLLRDGVLTPATSLPAPPPPPRLSDPSGEERGGGFQGFPSYGVPRSHESLPPRGSVPPSFGFTSPDEDYLPYRPRPVRMRPLNQTQLADRLGVVVSAITYWKMKPGFADWSRSRDPEGFAWRYSQDSKRFSPEIV